MERTLDLVYNLFIIWNVNNKNLAQCFEYIKVYNLFIIWNVNTFLGKGLKFSQEGL